MIQLCSQATRFFIIRVQLLFSLTLVKSVAQYWCKLLLWINLYRETLFSVRSFAEGVLEKIAWVLSYLWAFLKMLFIRIQQSPQCLNLHPCLYEYVKRYFLFNHILHCSLSLLVFSSCRWIRSSCCPCFFIDVFFRDLVNLKYTFFTKSE